MNIRRFITLSVLTWSVSVLSLALALGLWLNTEKNALRFSQLSHESINTRLAFESQLLQVANRGRMLLAASDYEASLNSTQIRALKSMLRMDPEIVALAVFSKSHENIDYRLIREEGDPLRLPRPEFLAIHEKYPPDWDSLSVGLTSVRPAWLLREKLPLLRMTLQIKDSGPYLDLLFIAKDLETSGAYWIANLKGEIVAQSFPKRFHDFENIAFLKPFDMASRGLASESTPGIVKYHEFPEQPERLSAYSKSSQFSLMTYLEDDSEKITATIGAIAWIPFALTSLLFLAIQGFYWARKRSSSASSSYS